ncbi:MAG TPA: PAS domain S-box protein [Xanthobacteraceae bacterium]|nr:PAS domain S-box protein [Xanthobacteraceae bacterium]
MSFEDTLAKAVLSTRSDAIVASDEKGAITFWNSGAERIFGFAPEEALGQSLDIIIPEQLRERHWVGYREVMGGRKSRYGEGDILAVPAIRKDGSRISVEFTIAPMYDAGGKMTGMASILRDVTKRFEELRALKKMLAKKAAAPAP